MHISNFVLDNYMSRRERDREREGERDRERERKSWRPCPLVIHLTGMIWSDIVCDSLCFGVFHWNFGNSSENVISNYASIFTFRKSHVKRQWLYLFLRISKIGADIAKRYLENILSFSQVAVCNFSKIHPRLFSAFSVLLNYLLQAIKFLQETSAAKPVFWKVVVSNSGKL